MSEKFDIPRDIALIPTLIGLAVLGLLLLLFRDLSDSIRHYLVPSLVVYVMWTALVAFAHIHFRGREKMKAKPEDRPSVHFKPFYSWVIVIVHALLIIFFMIYNYMRGVL